MVWSLINIGICVSSAVGLGVIVRSHTIRSKIIVILVSKGYKIINLLSNIMKSKTIIEVPTNVESKKLKHEIVSSNPRRLIPHLTCSSLNDTVFDNTKEVYDMYCESDNLFFDDGDNDTISEHIRFKIIETCVQYPHDGEEFCIPLGKMLIPTRQLFGNTLNETEFEISEIPKKIIDRGYICLCDNIGTEVKLWLECKPIGIVTDWYA